MDLEGKPTTVTKWIHGTHCVLSTEVQAIRMEDDREELYLKPEVVRFLDRMQQLADAGDVSELAKHGIVYERRSA